MVADVAVSALPVTSPVTSPVISPTKLVAVTIPDTFIPLLAVI